MSSNIGWLQRPKFKPESWNPIRARYSERIGWHCVRCAAGCLNCYSEAQNVLGLRGGTKEPYTVQSKAEVYLDEKTLTAPLHWRDPRMVFVCSMSDLFGEWVPAAWIAKIFEVMSQCPQHTFLVLTKRAGRMMGFMDQLDPVLPNIWAGVSVSTGHVTEMFKISVLCTSVPVAVRWVSYEPALEAVDWHDVFFEVNEEYQPPRFFDEGESYTTSPMIKRLERPDWLVIGGESGPNHRTLNIDHVASAVRQCQAAGVPVFVKQDSGPFPGKQGRIPDDLWIQEWPA